MKQLGKLAKDTYLAFLNLVYPKRCQGCGLILHYKNKFYLCKDCLKNIKINRPPFCLKCGRQIYGAAGLKAVCGQCIATKYNFDKAFFCCNYDGLIRELIHKFKYENKKFLIYLFDRLMTNFAKEHMDVDVLDMVVPVPLHRGKLQQRGFDQSLLLSKGLSQTFNLALSYNVLIRKKDTAQQTLLDKNKRLNNVKGVFCVKNNEEFSKKRVLLIDDVFTTAATANECAYVLKKAGAESVQLLTLARGL